MPTEAPSNGGSASPAPSSRADSDGPASTTTTVPSTPVPPGSGPQPSTPVQTQQPETRGFLYKWTNYLKGYQKRWFVLANGLLHYYRNQGEMSRTCRGSISLNGAHIITEDSCNFVVSNAGGTQTYHLRAASEKERQNWVTALELAKTMALKSQARLLTLGDEMPGLLQDTGSGSVSVGRSRGASPNPDEEALRAEVDKQELVTVVKFLAAKVEEMRTCHGLVEKHRHALSHSLAELETAQVGHQSPSVSSGVQGTAGGGSGSGGVPSAASVAKELGVKMKTVNERATLLNITTNAMINASSDFVEQASLHGKRWQKILENEREIRQRLEEMVQQLAKQQLEIESKLKSQQKKQQAAAAAAAAAAAQASSSSQPQLQHDQHNNIDSPPPDKSAPPSDRAKSPITRTSVVERDRQRSLASGGSCSEEDDEFEDAVEDIAVAFDVALPPSRHRRTDSEFSSGREQGSGDGDEAGLFEDGDSRSVGDEDETTDDEGEGGTSSSRPGRRSAPGQIAVVRVSCRPEDEDISETPAAASSESPTATNAVPKVTPKVRRTRIPDKPNISFSLWAIMKNCIGKDLSKIPVPVNFSEPLSMIQRIVEDFEYSEILDRAGQCTDNFEQMAHVAAFTVSAYSTTAIRTGKPFNPLLGETYECDRTDDKGFRLITEQVSHHPPMLAQYVEQSKRGSDGKVVASGWKSWQEFTMRSRFKGKYLEIEPLGIAHLEFPNGNHYTWRKVKTVVHNIVIGKLWIDQHGEMEIINHFTGDKCHMKFEPYSYFGGIAKKVTGTITSGSDSEKVEWVLNGTWDSKLEASKVIGSGQVKGKSSLEVSDSELLWKAHPPYPGSEAFYNMSKFACELNEEEEGVAPTDSRLRPDQRLMETGDWDDANTEKVRLEEKQRAKRREREAEEAAAAQEGRTLDPYRPTWFARTKDAQNGEKMIHAYSGGYWEAKQAQNWDMCPDLYSKDE